MVGSFSVLRYLLCCEHSNARRLKAGRVSVELSPKSDTGTTGKGEKVRSKLPVRVVRLCLTTPYLPQSVLGGSQLQEENEKLVTQNRRLLSELESTSQQLVQVSSKVGCTKINSALILDHNFIFAPCMYLSPQPREWGGRNDTSTGQSGKVKLLEAQVQLMQDKLAKVQREREGYY